MINNELKEKTTVLGDKLDHTYFFILVDMAIKLNKENRKRLGDKCHQESSYRWLCEYATVKIDIGRQTGKTSYIIKNTNEKTIVLTLGADHIKTLKKCGIDEGALLITKHTLVDKLRGINFSKYDTVYIDECDCIGKAVIDDFIKEIAIHWKDNIQEKTIIMFG
jgi:ribosomal protein L14E/L6E/L27E